MPLLTEIQGEIGSYPLFLETRDDRRLPVSDRLHDASGADVLSLIIACIRDGVAPWDTEEVARDMANRLSARQGLSALPLISRDPITYVGWYVRVRQRAD
jgi:hypothetical protein